jgi:hypothetical protein
VPIMRQLIATTSGGHSAILVVARRTSQRTQNPKRMTKGTNRVARSSRIPRKPSTLIRTLPPTIHPHLHQYLLRHHLLVLLLTLVLVGLPIK